MQGVPCLQEEVARNTAWGPEFQRKALDSLAESAGKGGVEEEMWGPATESLPPGAGRDPACPTWCHEGPDSNSSPHLLFVTWAEQETTMTVSGDSKVGLSTKSVTIFIHQHILYVPCAELP